jgi:NADPH:quinone reductase
MRAVVLNDLGSTDYLALQKLNPQDPRDNEVLVRTHAIGLNFPDLLVIEGKYQVIPPLPFVPGKELAGIVESIGANVTHIKPGDRVLAMVEYGACAEQAVAPRANCYRIPDSISFADGAALGVAYQSAYYALFERGDLKSGEWVLVNGASGTVGIAALQLAKAHGARVLAGVRGDAQADLARNHGADHIIRFDRPDLKNSLREQVRSATEGHGADVIIDAVGGDVFDASLRALAWCGRLVVVGFMAGRISEVKVNYLLLKNISVTGLQISDYRDRDPRGFSAVQDKIFALCVEGKIKPPIVATYPLEQFRDAFAHVARSAQGKILLTID